MARIRIVNDYPYLKACARACDPMDAPRSDVHTRRIDWRVVGRVPSLRTVMVAIVMALITLIFPVLATLAAYLLLAGTLQLLLWRAWARPTAAPHAAEPSSPAGATISAATRPSS
jgi:hypothetical protein